MQYAPDDREPALEVLALLGIHLRFCQPRAEAASDRFDGRQRIIQFMTEHANQALPRRALFFAQGAAYV